MTLFTFPALAGGTPSRRNWYQELLGHVDCAENPTKVREAYQSHRERFVTKQIQAFTTSETNPVTPDQALIEHLSRQERARARGSANGEYVSSADDLDAQEVNCLVIWTRPPPPIMTLILWLQNRVAALVGTDLYLIPASSIHLSVIELSHRHSVSHLRSVADRIGTSQMQNILDHISTLSNKPKLGLPQLNFDSMGIALDFLPLKDPPYTYHHLRNEMHSLALESGISIDMCYTAPSAHVTLARFVGNAFFEWSEAKKEFLALVRCVNDELRGYDDNDGGLEWVVGEDMGLEVQLGYLKFGRGREEADAVGRI